MENTQNHTAQKEYIQPRKKHDLKTEGKLPTALNRNILIK